MIIEIIVMAITTRKPTRVAIKCYNSNDKETNLITDLPKSVSETSYKNNALATYVIAVADFQTENKYLLI